MIRSFGNNAAFGIWTGQKVRGFPADMIQTARRRLMALDSAEELRDLRTPPGNRLEKLKGDLKEYHSIRINEKWRIVFKWSGDGKEHFPEEVQVVDYHK